MKLNEHFCAERQVEVNARAELDEAQVLVDIAVFADTGIGDDASSHCASHLPRQYLRTVGCLDDDCTSLVLFARLGQPSFVEIAVVMADMLDGAVDGNPVGVDVEETHEDAHHDAAVVEIFCLFRLFHHDDLAVGRRQYESFRLALESADGTLEEVQQDGIQNSAYRYADVERKSGIEDVEYGKVEHPKHDGAPEKRGLSFVMKAYFL